MVAFFYLKKWIGIVPGVWEQDRSTVNSKQSFNLTLGGRLKISILQHNFGINSGIIEWITHGSSINLKTKLVNVMRSLNL